MKPYMLTIKKLDKEKFIENQNKKEKKYRGREHLRKKNENRTSLNQNPLNFERAKKKKHND